MTTTQKPNTAVLGELGGPDKGGFSGDAPVPTRLITITDEHGNVIYSKRTTDTAKAADSHIKLTGRQRATEWVDGEATVELIPKDVKRKVQIKRWGIAGLVAALVIGMVVSCNVQVQRQKENEETARIAKIELEQMQAAAHAPFTATVTLELLEEDGFQRLYNVNTQKESSCQGVGGYKDLALNKPGKINGISSTSVTSEALTSSCKLTYTFESVPGDLTEYVISLGWRLPITVTEDELKSGVDRTIGG